MTTTQQYLHGWNRAKNELLSLAEQRSKSLATCAVGLLENGGKSWAYSTVATQLSRRQGPSVDLLNDLGSQLFSDWVMVEKRKPGPKGPRAPEPKLCIVAGRVGVYVGLVMGGAAALTESGVVTITRSRHLRRYYVAGKVGDGSVTDLAALGLDPSSPSVTNVLEPATALNGVYRVLEVDPAVASSFGVL